MSLEEFLENLTLEEIEELKRLKLKRLHIYTFSKIDYRDLKKLFDISERLDKENFKSWFDSKIDIKSSDEIFLQELLKESNYIKFYNEENLKVKFIAPLLNRVNFSSFENEIRDFYEENLSYESEHFKLKGVCDFFVSKGLKFPEKPYFFIQEFKKNIDSNDPEPQLIAEMISAVELNEFKSIKGAYIIGAIWNFVILERLERHKYIYYVSQNFDSTKIEDLKMIYKNLLFVKDEIFALPK